MGEGRLHSLTVEGFWPIFFLGVVLKVPIGAALFLICTRSAPSPRSRSSPTTASTASGAGAALRAARAARAAAPTPPERVRFPTARPAGGFAS